jgi:hypothetical protein
MRIKILAAALFFVSMIFSSIACNNGTSSTPAPVYSQYQLEYRLFQNYPDVFWCDPDYYPVSREGQEQAFALEQYPAIKANAAEFAAILGHIDLANKTDYTDQEKLNIYKEHKKLNYAVTITNQGNFYNFVIRVGRDQGQRIEGTITSSGQIDVIKTETSYNTCPICLTRGTLISTPDGEIAVEQLRPGMIVWTQNEAGERLAASIRKTSSTAVPPGFSVLRLTLADGRTVTASPGHPSADSLALGSYKAGDILDGSFVVGLETEAYNGGFTYDLLPSGPVGLYWANGILLKSTLYGD